MLINSKHNIAATNRGFTLVELAVVIVIIGVLILGVLKGQEMIGNARVTSTVAQIKTVDSAVSQFKDMFDKQIPGDIETPATTLPNCTALPCSDGGDGNGRLSNPPAGNPIGTEAEQFFVHLAAAGLISGIDASRADEWGGRFLATPIPGGGIAAGDSEDGDSGDFGPELVSATDMPSGMYLNVYGGRPSAGTEYMQASQAKNIDTKLDDGAPETGFTRAKSGSNGNCVDGTTHLYNEDVKGPLCGLFINIQN